MIQEHIKKGLNAVIINPGSLIGPYDFEPSLVGGALIDMYAGKVPALLDVVSDYVDVRDVADGMIRAADKGRVGERYFLTGEVIPVLEMAGVFGKVSGKKVPTKSLPLWVGWGIVPFALAAAKLTGKPALLTPDMLRASVSNEVVSHDKASEELGFSVRPLHESLTDAVAWYGEQGMLPN